MESLTVDLLVSEAKQFCENQSLICHPDLMGITDGKAVGTYFEHLFQVHLKDKYDVKVGSSAKGIDLPGVEINTDIKITSIKQPQSSCPFLDAKQKVFGLGYNLLVMVYDKKDEEECTVKFLHCAFIKKENTADFTTTKRLIEMKNDGANEEDICAYLTDRNIPADEITYSEIAERIMERGLEQGYLTISNALQWRLQYKRVIGLVNSVPGVINYDWS